jgi:hypothetical protein
VPFLGLTLHFDGYCRTFRFGLYGNLVSRLVAVVMCLLLNVDCVLPWDAS